MLRTPALRVLLLATCERDLLPLLDSDGTAPALRAGAAADWQDEAAADGFAARLEAALAVPAAADAPDALCARAAATAPGMFTIDGPPALRIAALDPRTAALDSLLRLAVRADVVLLLAPAGRRLAAASRRAAELALLAGVPRLVIQGLAEGAPRAAADWPAQAEALRHDPDCQRIVCLPPPQRSGGTGEAPLAQVLAAAPMRAERHGVSDTGARAAGAAGALDASAPGAGDSLLADGFEADCLWLDAEPLLPGRSYALVIGGERCRATVVRLKYRNDPGSPLRLAASTLAQGEAGVGVLELDRAIRFAPFLADADRGGGVLVDEHSGRARGVVMLRFALRRAHNLRWQSIDVDRHAHAALKGQRPCIVWLTGLSGAGKSTIANRLQKRLHALGHHTFLLDGDNLRHGLNKDLGFTAADRVENIRRAGEVAKLMVDAGLIVITAFISPFEDERRMVRQLVEDGEFIEVFVDTPLAEAERRDPKGLYRKARSGALKNFTGIDSPYQAPRQPEIRIDTTRCSADEAAAQVLAYLRRQGRVRSG